MGQGWPLPDLETSQNHLQRLLRRAGASPAGFVVSVYTAAWWGVQGFRFKGVAQIAR